MASTTTVNADYCNITLGKNLTPQSALTSKLRTAILCVAFDCMTNYATCGMTVDLSACNRIKTIITAVAVGGVPDGIVTKYVPDTCNEAATGKLMAFQSSTCMAPLVELCAADTDFDCQTIKFQVTGF